MLIAAVCLYAFFLAPLFIKIIIKYEKKDKLFFIKVQLFGVFNIITVKVIKNSCGYSVYKNGKKINVSKFLSIKKMKSGIKIFSDYHIKSFYIDLSLGGENCEFKAGCITYLMNYFFTVVQNIKPYFNYDGKIYFNKENELNVYAHFKILFNFLVVFLSLLKTFWGKING